MPHSLKRPSPIERDTSTIPITLPSLRGERGRGRGTEGEGEREGETEREGEREGETEGEGEREAETEGNRGREAETVGEGRGKQRQGEEKVTSWMSHDIPPTHMKCTYSTSLYLQLSQSFSFHQTTLDRDL